MEILRQGLGDKSIRTNIRTKKLRSIGESSSIRVKRVVGMNSNDRRVKAEITIILIMGIRFMNRRAATKKDLSFSSVETISNSGSMIINILYST
jgi:hypothetical protein